MAEELSYESILSLLQGKGMTPVSFKRKLDACLALWDLLQAKPTGKSVGDEIQRCYCLWNDFGGPEKCPHTRRAIYFFIRDERFQQIKEKIQKILELL